MANVKSRRQVEAKEKGINVNEEIDGAAYATIGTLEQTLTRHTEESS